MLKKNLFQKIFNKLVISITERIESFFNFFKKNLFQKIFNKLVISITERIESFFNFFKKISNKLVILITERIESFFNFFKDNFLYKKNFKKFLKLKYLKTVDKKIFLSLAVIIFIIIGYFLIPLFYDKNKIKNQLEAQILNQYNLKVKLDKSLKYRLFPKPHFFSNNTLIEYENNDIAVSKKTKVFISTNNLFSSDFLNIENLIFNQTNFKIRSSDLKFFIDLLNNSISDQSIDFPNSNFFYLDKNDDNIFLINFKNFNYSYQEDFFNIVRSKLKMFDIPITLKINHDILKKKFFVEINSYPLRLKIKNNSDYKDGKLDGQLDLTIINNKKKINYNLKDNSIKFTIKGKKFLADIKIKPFFLSSDLEFNQIDLKNIFKDNSILVNILKSEILNNVNLDGKIDIIINNIKSLKSLTQIKLTITFEEGGVYIHNLTTTFKKLVKININDGQLIVDGNKLKLVGYTTLDFINLKKFYSHFQINKKERKNIESVTFAILFNFDDEIVEIDNLKIDGKTNQNLEKFLNNFNSKKKIILNKIVLRNSIKDFFEAFSLD